MGKINALTIAACIVGPVALATPGIAQDQPGEGRSVIFAQSDSLGANYVRNQIMVQALRDLGYEVNLTTVNTTAFFQAAADGDMDITADVNMPQRQVAYDKVAQDVELVGEGMIKGGGYNGYMIDKATAEAYGIKDITALKDPEIAKLFDTDGDGTANLMNCDPGWNCGDVVDFQLQAFGLTDTVESVRAKYEPLMAETFARHRQGEPVLYYAWTPSFVTQTLVPGEDVVWLPIPFDALPEGIVAVNGHDVAGVVGCAAGQNPCKMATGSWNWVAAANRDFASENPAVVKLAEVSTWPIDVWSGWEAEMKTDSSDPAIKNFAAEWIEANRDTYDGWLDEARAAVGN